MKRAFSELKKNLQALKQANITLSQMSNLMKTSDVWWKVTVNLKEIEGSWPGVVKRYMKIFQGRPRKNIRQENESSKKPL